MATPETTTETATGCGCTSSCDVPSAPQVVQIEEACNLAEVELRDRMTELRKELLPHARRIERLANGRAWEFPADMRTALEELVAFERECCSGLTWNVDDRGGDTLWLSMEGIDPDAAVFSQIETTVSDAQPNRGGITRLMKAGGLGFGFTFFVCCILPLALAALVGGSAAASFAKLDNPVVILTGSMLAAVPAWLFLRRREAQQQKTTNCGPGC